MKTIITRLVFGVLLVSHAAQAQVVDNRDFEIDRVRPTTSIDGTLNVSSPTLAPRHSWNAMVAMGYSRNLLLLRQDIDGAASRETALLRNRMTLWVGGSYVVLPWLEVGSSLPVILFQDQAGRARDLGYDDLDSVGVGDWRFSGIATLLREKQYPLWLATEVVLSLPTGSPSAAYFGDDTVSGSLGVLVGKTLGSGYLHGGLSYWLRSQASGLNSRTGDEVVIDVAYRHDLEEMLSIPLRAEAALRTGFGVEGGAQHGNHIGLDVNAGGVYQLTEPLGIFASVGTSPNSAVGTADFRMMAGVRWTAKTRDQDGDGILDAVDACVDRAEDRDGFEDEDGCPDEDNDRDGILDSADRCPNEAEDMDGFMDEDGCPESDNDGDKIVDAEDACPDAAGPAENKGCPDEDRDGDSVVDRLDNCPDVRGNPDNFGCVDPQLVALRTQRIETFKKVYFETDQTILKPESFALLDNLAQVLKAHPTISLRIEGHTDNTGTTAHNKELSQARVESVMAYLVHRDIDAKRLVAKGFGEERPIAPNDTDEGRSKNRRVEFHIKRSK